MISDLRNFPVIALNDLLLQDFFSLCYIVNITVVFLWKPVSIAENESAFTLDSHKSDFFVACKASLSINLLSFSFELESERIAFDFIRNVKAEINF